MARAYRWRCEVTGTRDDGGGRINHGHPMTTPQPDSLRQIVAEMRASDSAGLIRIGSWADRIEALAASAQVREIEPVDPERELFRRLGAGLRHPMTAADSRISPTVTLTVPAAEPVPVAQGDGGVGAALRALEQHEWISKDGNYLLGETTIAALIRQQQATIADHARRVAELEKDVLDMADKAIDAYIQRDTAEASLAAFRALLNTCVDVIEEGLSDSQSYDYRPRAHSCAENIKRTLNQEAPS